MAKTLQERLEERRRQLDPYRTGLTYAAMLQRDLVYQQGHLMTRQEFIASLTPPSSPPLEGNGRRIRVVGRP